MRLETLNYIQKLLEDNEETTLKKKRVAYEEREASDGLQIYPEMCEIYDKAKADWYAAKDALEDFNNQDW